MIGNLQNSITLRFFLPPFVNSIHSDEIVINLCKFLDLLSKFGTIWIHISDTINDKNNQIVDYSDFYNEQICAAIFEDLRTEFINWKHQKGYIICRSTITLRFAFAKLPCILKPELKSKLLQVESTIAQRERREVIHSHFFVTYNFL